MNHRKYLNSAALQADPLCGIDTYKDTLNLASGQTTRQIKKLVLTGQEGWMRASNGAYYVSNLIDDELKTMSLTTMCSHYESQNNVTGTSSMAYNKIALYGGSSPNVHEIYIAAQDISTVDDFKSYLATQYAAETPVTIWYVLATPVTEQIAVPSGLSGTLEGLLTQSGTPTPLAPIYPTAVTGEGWYNINTYKRSVLVWNTDTAYERDSGAWT